MNASQPLYGGGTFDAFVLKLSADSTLLWSTYWGGAGEDAATSVSVDESGMVTVTGFTSGGFPVWDAYQSTYGGGSSDAFIVKYDASGSPAWSTYLGGAGSDAGRAIAADTGGNMMITGSTASPDFPMLSPHQAILGGGNDAFVVKCSADGDLFWSTFYGGSDLESGDDGVSDVNGNVVFGGTTKSVDFPVFNAHQPGNAGGDDAFVVKLHPCAATVSILAQPADTTVCGGNPVSFVASASGTPAPIVQWMLSTDNGRNWQRIPGATNQVLTFNASLDQNGYLYRALITNPCAAVRSREALLLVAARLRRPAAGAAAAVPGFHRAVHRFGGTRLEYAMAGQYGWRRNLDRSRGRERQHTAGHRDTGQTRFPVPRAVLECVRQQRDRWSTSRCQRASGDRE
ncbi:MAG: SBBP repeat-containing protein [Ignavibacteria bacterium]|nr:SBBP repeat-containing protein [Ignavibacteria bacterium]